jgi:PAS domain S-box-containing protein
MSEKYNPTENVNCSQEELKLRYRELQVIKDLIQSLGGSFNVFEIMGHIIAAMQELVPQIVVCYIDLASPAKYDYNIVRVFSEIKLGPDYFEILSASLEDYLQNSANFKNESNLIKEYSARPLRYEIISGTANAKNKIIPGSFLNLDFKIPGLFNGFMNFSAPDSDRFSENDINLLRTISESAAQTVTRSQSLVASEQSRLSDLIESMDNGVLMFDINKKIIAVNPVFKKIVHKFNIGYNLDEFLDFFLKNNIELDGKIKLRSLINKVLKNAKPLHLSEVNIENSVFEVALTPVRDYEGVVTGGAIILHDITHIKEVDKLKTDFVSVASHQLRTPLTAIKLFIEMLLTPDVGSLNKEQREYLSNIEESSIRMIKLVNNLLNVSRIETNRLKIEPVATNLAVFIKEIMSETKPLADIQKCHLKFTKPKKEIKEIMVDQILMRQVVSNLIANAINYSKCAGNLIEVKLMEKFDKEPGVIISVKDEGIGIPLEAQSKIFGKFFRANNAVKSSPEGSGLGMYLAKMVTEASGGKIWFESEENKGSTFYVFIPSVGMRKRVGEKPLIV